MNKQVINSLVNKQNGHNESDELDMLDEVEDTLIEEKF